MTDAPKLKRRGRKRAPEPADGKLWRSIKYPDGCSSCDPDKRFDRRHTGNGLCSKHYQQAAKMDTKTQDQDPQVSPAAEQRCQATHVGRMPDHYDSYVCVLKAEHDEPHREGAFYWRDEAWGARTDGAGEVINIAEPPPAKRTLVGCCPNEATATSCGAEECPHELGDADAKPAPTSEPTDPLADVVQLSDHMRRIHEESGEVFSNEQLTDAMVKSSKVMAEMAQALRNLAVVVQAQGATIDKLIERTNGELTCAPADDDEGDSYPDPVPDTVYAETSAMVSFAYHLEQLDPNQRHRVLTWAISRYPANG